MDGADTAAYAAPIDAVVDEQWSRLGEPGTWLTGAERVDLIRVARDPGVDVGLDTPTRRAAAAVAHDAARITAASVDGLESDGLPRERYVEVVGVVSRVAAIDTYELGLGRSPRDVPTARPGEPDRTVDATARRRAGWVPTVGAIGPPSALSAVTAEATEQEALHGALYLTYADMADLRTERGLSRAQMELVAARVSYLNDCLF